jgi:hypothetical protein
MYDDDDVTEREKIAKRSLLSFRKALLKARGPLLF